MILNLMISRGHQQETSAGLLRDNPRLKDQIYVPMPCIEVKNMQNVQYKR